MNSVRHRFLPNRAAPPPASAWVLLFATIAMLAACTTERIDRAPIPQSSARPGTPGTGSDDILNRPLGERVGRNTTAGIRFAIGAAGSVPYDSETLPLLSPDGRFIATQTGVAPSFQTVLAQPGSTIPLSTRIEIYALPELPNGQPTMAAAVEEPVILGRSVTHDGFLIEAPRESGARWLGLASWENGTVRWLVSDDETISAMATLGPHGQLACSQRRRDESAFNLAVRSGTDWWHLPADQGSWLMPTWSGVGDGLFALLLRGEMLDLVHMIASDAATARRTLRILPLATSGSSIVTAYQTLSTTVTSPARTPPDRQEVFFFHPSRLVAALWRPPGPPLLFDRNTYAATADQDDPRSAIVTGQEQLTWVNLTNPHDRVELLSGIHIARATASTERPYLLLQPSDGRIELIVLRFLPPDQPVTP